jgi:hypothetical protein
MRSRFVIGGGLVLVAVTAVGCNSSSGSKAAVPTTGLRATVPAPTGACAGSGANSGGSGGSDVLVPGDIPDNQAFVAYQSPTGGYRVNVPEGWARQDAAGATVFTDKLNSIRVDVSAAAAQPTVASAQTSEVAALATSAACFQPGTVSQVNRKAGPAVLVTYRASSSPEPVTGKVVRLDVERYEFWRAGKLIAITLSSPQGSDNVDPWRKVTDSFTWAT